MQRKTFDRLISSVGLLLTAVLIVAGALLTWAHGFVHDQVHDQLTLYSDSGGAVSKEKSPPFRLEKFV